MKKCLSIVLAALTFTLMILVPSSWIGGESYYADAEAIMEKQYPTGDLPVSEEILKAVRSDPNAKTVEEILQDKPTSRTTIVQVDNSKKKYFPVIKAQMYSSCSAWSSVYYMYSYAVNQLHDTAATYIDENGNEVNDSTKVYSPTWNYSLFSADSDTGTVKTEYYEFSKHHGQLPLSQCSTYCDAYPYPSIPSNNSHIVNALSTRVSYYNYDDIKTDSTPITGTNSSLLDDIKDMLANGYILGVSTCTDYAIKKTTTGEDCIYRIGNTASGHALTIVGYCDSIECNINGDQIIQNGEKGAFKIANSWGPEWGNDGYIWLSYDALNEVSVMPGIWEDSFVSQRDAAFARGSESQDNLYWYFEVEDYEPNYVVLADAQVTDGEYVYTSLTRTNNNTQINQILNWGSQDNRIPLERSCKLAFDYASLATPINNYINGYTWRMEFVNGKTLTQSTVQMVDNLSAPIKSFQYDSTLKDWYCSVDLLMGDVDYSETITTIDAFTLYNYATYGGVLSNLQESLADLNADGAINTTDAYLLYNQVSGNARNIGLSEKERYEEFIRIMEEYRAQMLANNL